MKKYLIAAVLGLVVVVTLAVVLPLVLIKSPSPTEAYTRFNEACERGDFATAHKALAKHDAALLTASRMRTGWGDIELAPLSVEKEEIAGDEAQLTIYNSSTGTTIFVPCYKEKGEWKIAVSESTNDGGDSDY